MFQQDCAPVYKANSKKTWFDQFSVEELKRPAQSLDLNPTGKPLHLNPTVHHWDELESQLWVRSFHSTPVHDQMGTDSQRYTSKSWEKPSQKSGGCFGSIGSVSILMFWNEKSNNLISLWMSGIQNGYHMQLLQRVQGPSYSGRYLVIYSQILPVGRAVHGTVKLICILPGSGS